MATLYYRDHPFDGEVLELFHRELRPELVAGGATPLAVLRTEYAENNYPALPVRTGEHVFGWLARFPGVEQLSDHLDRTDRTTGWLASPPQRLRLSPTIRSPLR